ncbi:NAD(P)-binding protein [Thozetella sp. PMI_491]|nr:NAD(P)-binding protein [Thozetella sp. PMI_491]
MAHRILITGGSGYLGGSLLARLSDAGLPPYDKLFALVRTDAQAEAVRQYGAEPLVFKTDDETAVRESVVSNKITIVYYLVDAVTPEPPVYFIKALEQVKNDTGSEVHFLFTTGAKLFSSLAGAPTDRLLLDNDPELHEIHKAQIHSTTYGHRFYLAGVATNTLVAEEGEKRGVRTYVFAPCIVYGKGEGFGNKISIQTVAIVKAAKALGRVMKVDDGRPTWPVCHIIDNTNLYLDLLRAFLSGQEVGHGKNGYFLASSGSVAWDDLYAAMAVALKKRGAIEDETMKRASQEDLEKVAPAFGYPVDFVPSLVGGMCTFTAEHGKAVGWKPQFAPEHAIEAADEEVDFILKTLG